MSAGYIYLTYIIYLVKNNSVQKEAPVLKKYKFNTRIYKDLWFSLRRTYSIFMFACPLANLFARMCLLIWIDYLLYCLYISFLGCMLNILSGRRQFLHQCFVYLLHTHYIADNKLKTNVHTHTKHTEIRYTYTQRDHKDQRNK